MPSKRIQPLMELNFRAITYKDLAKKPQISRTLKD